MGNVEANLGWQHTPSNTVKRKTSQGSREIKGRGGKNPSQYDITGLNLGKWRANAEGKERGGRGCPTTDVWDQKNVSGV